MTRAPLLVVDEAGLTCPAGGFTIDPWGPVDRAVLTHAHADHARPVMTRALVAQPGALIARDRLPGIEVEAVPYRTKLRIGDVDVSLHPSGHILGAAQVRIERAGEVWVVSGDYKLAPDPTCAAFEPVPCHTFITEATFALPLFRWAPPADVFADMAQWCSDAKAQGHACLVYAYALGKAPRILASLAHDGPIYTHGAVQRVLDVYRKSNVAMPATTPLVDAPKRGELAPGSLVLAPPRAQNTPWARKLEAQDTSAAFCSGWMRIRGPRRRKVVERGFVLSDHADWPGLLTAVTESKAERVLVTHGYTQQLARFLVERGKDAAPLATNWEGEIEDDAA
jgi:putative mRNA 3-end processing factor